MRTIKFRVWDKQHKRMILVPHLHFGDDGSGLTTTMMYKKPDDFTGMLVMGENAELMQFTGLHDRYGKEVYEGDIVRCQDVSWGEYIRVIEYKNGLWNYSEPLVTREQNPRYGWEVLGNLYEHPELARKT